MRYPVDFSEESLAQASMRSPSIVVCRIFSDATYRLLVSAILETVRIESKKGEST